jgi:hypothetical protein
MNRLLEGSENDLVLLNESIYSSSPLASKATLLTAEYPVPTTIRYLNCEPVWGVMSTISDSIVLQVKLLMVVVLPVSVSVVEAHVVPSSLEIKAVTLDKLPTREKASFADLELRVITSTDCSVLLTSPVSDSSNSISVFHVLLFVEPDTPANL